MDLLIEAHPTPNPTRHSSNLAAYAIEIVLIIVMGIYAASVFADFDPNKRLGGGEAEYLTRSEYTLPTLLQQKGYIPLWDPYMELGDPMLDNPVSFAYNPFLTWPGFLFGPQNGTKVAIILSAILAGLGGWALGRVLGFGALARLLLALLCLGKGNMYSYLSQGHFSFFASQVYFPWVFAGVVGILKGYRRWPVVLTALSFALVFWTGSPWFPPAIVIAVGILTLVFVVHLRRPNQETKIWQTVRIEWGKAATVVLSLALGLMLAAVSFLPLWINKDRIGGSSLGSDYQADLLVVLSQFFNRVKDLTGSSNLPAGQAFAFYSFISPIWYVLLIIALLVVVGLWRRRVPNLPGRILLASAAIFVFCTLWGAGQNPVIDWFYQVIPLANQFRHVERVLGMASLWLAVIIALSVDSLWNYLVKTPIWLNQRRIFTFVSREKVRLLFAGILVMTSAAASFDVVSAWHDPWGTSFTRTENSWEDYCITWLRHQYPDQQLDVWTLDYKNIYTYYRNEVRHGWVGSDYYHAQPLSSTVYQGGLVPYSGGPTQLLPEFALGLPQFPPDWLAQNGYQPLPDSADPYGNNAPCVYRRDGAYSYAFTVTQHDLDTNTASLPVSLTTPITVVDRDYDRIALVAQAQLDNLVIVTVQELAFPGWTVKIDGKLANVESVGGLLGVALPQDGAQHTIYFQYLPSNFFIGAAVTLVMALIFILYLLRAERLLPKTWRHHFWTQIAEAWDLGQMGDGS